MRIAYGKLGRSIPLTLDDAGSHGGDIEVVNLLNILRCDHEVHVVSRNQSTDAQIPNVVNHWAPGMTYDDVPKFGDNQDTPQYDEFKAFLDERTPRLPPFDAWVLWIGQHGSSVHRIPMMGSKPLRHGQTIKMPNTGYTTRPLMSHTNYAYPLVHAVNYHGAKPVWLCPDPRNLFKLRDFNSPERVGEVLAQYDDRYRGQFYDPTEEKLRAIDVDYRYSGIELLAVPEEPTETIDWQAQLAAPPRVGFGALVNEGPATGKSPRALLVRNWLKPEHELFGHWSLKGEETIGRSVAPVSVLEVKKTLQRWRSTITFPASSTGWATTKPWEAFAAGTVCFAHSGYDTQDHIFGRFMPEELRKFLRVRSRDELDRKIDQLWDETVWRHYSTLQFNYLRESRQRLKNGAAEILWRLSEVNS